MNTVLKRSAIMVSLLVIAVLGTVFATRVSFAEDFYTIKIEYKYSGGSNAHDPYVAVLRGGEDLDVEVTNPVIPGYRPMDSPEPDANEVRTIDLKYTDIHESDTITVYYLPDKVHYKVRYFMQNIRDDLYTEDLSLSNDYYEKSGYTGTFPDELEHIEFDGFTSLFHEPDAIAADGSTEFKLYYDRNYYLVSFDLGEGGYGVEPVYAKHGTNYTIAEPKRMGYTFDGWVRSNENGDYLDENGNVLTDEAAIRAAADPFTHGEVPIGNTYYKAAWEPQLTKYSVVYWLQNPDSKLKAEDVENLSIDDARALIGRNYSVIAAKDVENVESGTPVNLETTVRKKSGQYTAIKNFFSYDLSASGDFPDISEALRSQLTGNQKYFYDFNIDLSLLQFQGNTDISVSGDGTTRINVYYDRAEFTLKFYYAKEDSSGKLYLTSGTGNYSRKAEKNLYSRLDSATWKQVSISLPTIDPKYSSQIPDSCLDFDEFSGNKYYYYEKKCLYGANMANVWFNDAFSLIPGGQYSVPYRFTSWAVEYGTKYYFDHKSVNNYTVKGFYEKLGNDLMFLDYNTDGTAKDTATGYDYRELHYVASWSSGAGSSDNVRPYCFTYKNYVRLLPYEEDIITDMGYDDGVAELKSMGNYIDIITNNGRHYGLTENNKVETFDWGEGRYKNYSGYELAKAVKGNQTAVDLTGFTLVPESDIEEIYSGCGTLNPQSTWYAYDVNGDEANHFDEKHHADVVFLYNRNHFTLQYRSNNIAEKSFEVYYNAPLNQAKFSYTPTYYNPELAAYFRFAGWYHTPYYYRQMDFSTERMPADDTTLYAKWVPATFDVTFYNDFRSYSLNNALHTANVGYNTLIETSEIPEDDKGAVYKLTEPSSGAKFAGWYYIDENNQPARFDPETIPVTRELKLYAEWVSKDTAKYKVIYTEQGTGVEVAPPTIGTVFVSKTKTFNAKGGSELNDAHKWVDGGANWWPTLSSHSMLIESNYDGFEFEPNTTKFEYIKKSKVWYQVSYIDKETGQVLRNSQDIDTAYAAVTERAQYVEGYIPDKLSRSIVLSASVNSNEEAAKREELKQNQIIFFYTPSDNGTLYQIDHYLQNADDDSQYDLYYSETQTAVIGDTVNVAEDVYTRDICTSLAETGYAIDNTKTTIKVNGNDAELSESVTLDGNVTVISVYYNRSSYKYTVKYYDYEAEKQHDGDPTLWDGEIKAPDTYDAQPAGKAVAIYPPAKLTYTYEKDGETQTAHYSRIGSEQRSITIRPDTDPPVTNIIKIYYKRDSQRKLSYKVFCNADVSETYATLSTPQELPENQEEIAGCTVTPVPDNDESLQGRYVFKGWYSDPLSYKTAEPLGTDYHFAPSMPGADMTYYAVFEQKTVHADVEIRYNNSGVYTDDASAAQDTDGNMTGYKTEFASPADYKSGEETPFLKNSKFSFSLKPFDSRIYKYEFAGWYEVLESGDVIHRIDITTGMTVDKDARTRNYRYIAMFKEKPLEESVDIEIKYCFETRSNGMKTFVFKDTLSGDELAENLTDAGAYELNDEYIMKNAPFESNYGKTLCWTDKGMEKTSDVNHKKLTTTVYAEQSNKKVYVNYRMTPAGGYTAIDTTIGANRLLDEKLAVLDLRDVEYEGKQFSYWEIKKSADARANVIAKCYDPWFSFCIMDNYWISPVFEDAEQPTKTAKLNPDNLKTGEEDWLAWTWSDGKADGTLVTPSYDLTFTGLKDNVVFARVPKGTTELENEWSNVWNQTPDLTVVDGAAYILTSWDENPNVNKMYGTWSQPTQKSITLTHLGYFRNRWTDTEGNIASSGATDLLYSDFEIAFADGQNQIYGAGSDYKTGVVFELCGVFNGETFDPAAYSYHSDEANLKAAIIAEKKPSVYNYDSSDSSKRRSIQISEIPTGSLTNKNRVEFFKGYRNTYKDKDGVITYTNKTYIMKATAYLIAPDGSVTLSNSEYICLSDIASKNMAVNGVCVSND